MISSFIIMFRETLEAALIIGILLSYLNKTGQKKFNPIIYLSTGAGILFSILCAYLFNKLAGGFEGRSEQIFEGVVMIIGAILLSTMILWMMNQQHSTEKFEKITEDYISRGKMVSLSMLVFFSVLREGVESVIFLGALQFSSGSSITGASLGIGTAVILGILIFIGSRKISLKMFFSITNVLLVLFAAGLVANGIHEFQEATLIPVLIEHIWDINYMLNDKGLVGGILKGLFGYNGNPSLIEIAAYSSFIILAALLWKRKEG